MGPDLIVIKGTWAWKPIKLNSSSSAYLLILWPWEGELIPRIGWCVQLTFH